MSSSRLADAELTQKVERKRQQKKIQTRTFNINSFSFLKKV